MRAHLLRCFAVISLALIARPLAAVPVAPFSASYEVRRNGSVLGEARLQLAPDGDAWRFTTQTRGTHGLARAANIRIDESTRFRYLDGQAETLEYRYTQRTTFNSRERGVVVDADGGRIELRNRNNRQELPYVRGVVDRQLATVVLMQAVAAGRRGAQTLQVADRNDVEAQAWMIGGVEAVPLDTAQQRGLRIERQRDPAEGRNTLLWLDENEGHIPLRIEQREDDGETIEMRLLRRE